MSNAFRSIPTDTNLSSPGVDCDCSPFDDHSCGKPDPPMQWVSLSDVTPAPTPLRPAFLPPLMKDNQCPHLPKSAEALEWALERLGVDVRQNMRWYTTEWARGGEWAQMTSRAAARMRSDIQSAFVVKGYNGIMPLKFGRDAFNEALDSVLFDREVDPFLEYLEELPKPTGRRYLAGSIAHCFDVAEGYEQLAEWASRSIFLGAVWRAYRPGSVLDEMPIIVGPGGIGKTTFLRKAVPQHLTGLYGSGLDLAETPKGKVEALQGKVIVECSDMAGATLGDANKIKDFISRTDDGSVRLAYRRDPEPSPRRCVLVGTADRSQFLRPDKNPRRFVPILLQTGKAFKVIRYMDRYRDRLWAEAKEHYAKGLSPRLPDELKELAHNMACRAMERHNGTDGTEG